MGVAYIQGLLAVGGGFTSIADNHEALKLCIPCGCSLSEPPDYLNLAPRMPPFSMRNGMHTVNRCPPLFVRTRPPSACLAEPGLGQQHGGGVVRMDAVSIVCVAKLKILP